MLHEIVINLHMHTTYSDGHGSHREIAKEALDAGLDAVIITDHNVYVDGLEGYHNDGDRQVLVLVGEEVHDQSRIPQKNHLLVLGVDQELAPIAWNIQRLLASVENAEGLSFLAHPFDPAAPAVGEEDISWVEWDVQGFTGIELWNGFSEFKSLLKTKLHAIFYAYQPDLIAHGPPQQLLKKWDELTSKGSRIVAIGGSDAHALPANLGPLHRTLFPYSYHFRGINTHLMVEEPLVGDVQKDKRLIYDTLAKGRAFIGYDLPGSTRGFKFVAHGLNKKATIGDEITLQTGVTFQIHLPQKQECRLIRDGEPIMKWENQENCTYIATNTGVYRVEVYYDYRGKKRGWIFSNPIYVR